MIPFKGIALRDRGELQWILRDRSKELVLPEHFVIVLMPFSCANSKKHSLAVSNLKVNQRMMGNKRK
jgi:hypothetical protein